MIELTVKTLDSRNHAFSVEDDITVEQFKVKIADTVNIPAETQRIIYCGRVLQDSSKLSDYDVNGKVVHLVQRAPPSAGQRSRSTTPPATGEQGQRPRLFRGLDGNTMYLGSMAFPSNLMESQNIVPPPPTHSLAGSRLNVARRMLRRAEAVIRLLENPSARPNEQPSLDENQEEEEVTPVIEARVIVPRNGNEPIDQAMVLSAVQNSLMNAEAMVLNRREGSETAAQRSIDNSTASTPGDQTPPSSSSENVPPAAAEAQNSEPGTANNASSVPENTSRTSEMAELLTMLGQLQIRFAPFLENYQNFMRDDPVVAPENARQTQAMLTRVSEVLHFLGHAYHSLSDIIIRVRSPPPRPLLCRPILIQHSAVVHAGIPIQVEAQINLSPDRPANQFNSSQSQTTTPSATATTTNTSSAAPPPASGPDSTPAPNFAGFPSFFAAGPTSMRVGSFPLEIRTVRTGGGASNSSSTSAAAPPSSGGAAQPQRQSNASESAAHGDNSADPNAEGFNMNNPNVEFFMEVTPERITIDALEAAILAPDPPTNNLLREAFNGPPPEFLQSLMRMAGHIINQATPPLATSESSISSANSTTTGGNAQQAGAAGQNSQARGNTQTNPTTATHTRSTSRPHVHLAQQAIQGGFDPFLPCNSHHVTHGGARRVAQAQNSSAQQSTTAQNNNNNGSERAGEGPRNIHVNIGGGGNAGGGGANQGYFNIINGIVNSFRSAYNRQTPPARPAPNEASNAAPTQNNLNNIELMPMYSIFSNLTGQPMSELVQTAPTLQQILQQFQQDDSYVEGESIFIDFLMLLIRNITLVDLFTLANGLDEPLLRNRQEIRNFVRTRVLNGAPEPENIRNGTDRLLTEMQPVLENFSQLPVRDNVDMVRSTENLLRNRFPELIRIAANLEPSNVQLLIQQFVNTVKDLCAMALSSSANGQEGVEQLLDHILHNLMEDIPRDIQDWTLITSRRYLRRILSNLNNRDDVIRPFIAHKETDRPTVEPPSAAASVVQSARTDHVEAMELDDQEATGSGRESFPTSTIVLESIPTPGYVLGSEAWHSQVPEDWVPIIARDAQKQRRQNSQGPFSDAYLSGMPSKRRKIVNSAKPQGSLSQVISDSVRQAVTATGLAHVAPLETVVQQAGASTDIQQAYRSLLRNTVQNSLRENEDFSAERFPNASNYFNNSSSQEQQ